MIRSTSPLYVQFGCGLCAPSGWLNFDVSPALRMQRIPLFGRFFVGRFGAFPKAARYGDIVRGLPVESGGCDAVYCSHVLEHLSLTDLRTALRNVFKVLKPGGVFRFVLPDLEFFARQYLQDPGIDACSKFMRETYLGREIRERGIKGIARSILGNSQHLWMWDFKGLKFELESVGFGAIRRAHFGDSTDPMFQMVEESRRWIDQLGIEAKKP